MFPHSKLRTNLTLFSFMSKKMSAISMETNSTELCVLTLFLLITIALKLLVESGKGRLNP